MIKLVILGTRGIPARYGGYETFADQLATRLASRGVQVTVCCPSPAPKSNETYSGVILRYVKYPALGKYAEMFWDARCFCAVRGQYDVVYMLGMGGAFAAWVPRLFGASVWINTDGIEWKRTKFTGVQRAYIALVEALSVLLATRIIADSKAIATYLRKRYFGWNTVSTIAYGADIPSEPPAQKLLEEWDLQADGYFVVVCRLEPENHVLEIVEGYLQSISTLPLVVLGNIENPNQYVKKLLAYRGDRVHFIGTLYDQNKLAALRFHARAYLHGHSVGGTNPSLLEAMACSNLVIAHDNPFNREVIGDAGLFFSTHQQLTTIVDAINAHQVNGQALRQQALDTIRARYQWEQITDAYYSLLLETVK